MGKIIFAIISWAMSNLVARILTSIGFAILGTITFTPFIQYFVNKAISQLNAVPMIGLLGLAGIDVGISVIISAIFIRLYLSTVVQSLKLVKKRG